MNENGRYRILKMKSLLRFRKWKKMVRKFLI
jgi:hypothetical protein